MYFFSSTGCGFQGSKVQKGLVFIFFIFPSAKIRMERPNPNYRLALVLILVQRKVACCLFYIIAGTVPGTEFGRFVYIYILHIFLVL
jgi:hypothetical protein